MGNKVRMEKSFPISEFLILILLNLLRHVVGNEGEIFNRMRNGVGLPTPIAIPKSIFFNHHHHYSKFIHKIKINENNKQGQLILLMPPQPPSVLDFNCT